MLCVVGGATVAEQAWANTEDVKAGEPTDASRGLPKFGWFKNIERLGAELHLHPLGNGEAFDQAEVEIPVTRGAKEVSTRPVRTEGWKHE